MSLLDRPRAAAFAARAGWRTAGSGIPPSHLPLRTMDNRQMMELYGKDLAAAPTASMFGGGWQSGLTSLYRTGPARLRALAQSYGGTQDSVSWVFSCTSLIASTLGSYPYKYVDDAFEPVENPPDDLVALLRRPNPKWTYFDLMEALATDLELVGNAYLLKDQMNGYGQPKALYRLRPDVVRIAVREDGQIRGFVYTPQQGMAIPYEPEEIIHFKYPNPVDDYYGMGTVEAISGVLDQIAAENLHITGFFQNGARISGVLTIPETLTDAQFERLKQSYVENYAGPANAYKVLIAEGTSDYKPIVTPPAAAGVVDLSKLKKDETLAAFGVPAPLLGGVMENANYKMEESQHIFTRAMIPRTRRISERISVEMITPGWGLALTVDAHANEPLEVRIGHAKEMLQAGSTLNQALEAMGQPSSDHPLADTPLIPSSLIPIDIAGAPPRPGRSIPLGDQGEPGAAELPAGSPANNQAGASTLQDHLADLPDQVRAKDVGEIVRAEMARMALKAALLLRGWSDFVAKDSPNTGAMVALYPPEDLAAQVALDGGEPAEQLHLTLAFLGDAATIEDAAALRAAVEAWAAETPPLEGEVSGVGLFTGGPDPVTYLSVDIPALPSARQDLVEALDKAGVPASDEHGFTPHVTLDYEDRTADVEDAGGTPLAFDSVALVLGEAREDFPLGGVLAPSGGGGTATLTRPPTTPEVTRYRRSARAATSDAARVWGTGRASRAPSAPRAAAGTKTDWTPPEFPRGFESPSSKAAAKETHRTVRDHQARVLRLGVDTFEPLFRDYFKAQRDRVMQKLSEFGSGQRSARLRAGATKAKDDLSADAIFDLAAENAALEALYLPALDEVGAVAADTPPSLTGAVAWDVSNPAIATMRDQMGKLITRINDTTRDAISDVVAEGMRRGYSVPQIANGFTDEKYPGVMGVFDEASGYRAEMIARTESALTFNGASSVSYRDAGVEYVEILDGEGDDICAAADGSVWTVDEFDADPLGHPNCSRAAVPAEAPASAVDDGSSAEGE